jgi:hypothetical protein
MNLLYWDIYEIRSISSLHGIMLRGRLRKFANQNDQNLLVENEETGDAVRFALLSGSDSTWISEFARSVVSDADIKRVRDNIPNPVLSKLQVNLDERYTT